jgi:hypothetical protein
MAADPAPELFEALFIQLVMSLNEAAMVQMGKLVNPGSGKTEYDLNQASGTLDLLRMLQAKTQGNLSEQEQQLVDQTLVDLEMNFIYEQDRLPKDREKNGKPEEKPSGSEPKDFSPGNRPGQNN